MTDSNVVRAFTKSFVEAYRSYGLPEGEFSYLDFNTMTTVLVIPKEEMPEYLQELLDSEGSELIDNNLYYIEIDRDEDGDECFSVMEKTPFWYEMQEAISKPSDSSGMAEEEIDAAIDEANALIVSLPTVAEVEAQKKADRRKHLRLV
jgi:hypothetical protein